MTTPDELRVWEKRARAGHHPAKYDECDLCCEPWPCEPEQIARALRGAADRIEKLEAGLRLIQNMTDHADLLNDLETRARIGVIHADARALLGEGTAPDEEGGER